MKWVTAAIHRQSSGRTLEKSCISPQHHHINQLNGCDHCRMFNLIEVTHINGHSMTNLPTKSCIHNENSAEMTVVS
jgi:hypothetical protein